MPKVKVLKYDAKTKTQEITEEDAPEMPSTPSEPVNLENGINFKKLKQVLKQKGIINDFSEVE